MKAQELIEILQKYDANQDVEFLIYGENFPKLISDITIYHTNEIADTELGSFIDVFDLEHLSKQEMMDEIKSQNLILFEINL